MKHGDAPGIQRGRGALKRLTFKAGEIQYSPKIMHAQEVAQEVLAPQEHARGKKKLHVNCAFSARSSKRNKFKILSARSRKKLRVLLQTADNPKKFTVNSLQLA